MTAFSYNIMYLIVKLENALFKLSSPFLQSCRNILYLDLLLCNAKVSIDLRDDPWLYSSIWKLSMKHDASFWKRQDSLII